jgi:hypothetical protein
MFAKNKVAKVKIGLKINMWYLQNGTELDSDHESIDRYEENVRDGL